MQTPFAGAPMTKFSWVLARAKMVQRVNQEQDGRRKNCNHKKKKIKKKIKKKVKKKKNGN